jgi:hypothetical protein
MRVRPKADQEHQMRRSIVFTTILASLAFAAQANDGVELSLKTKALASAGAITKQSDAPFTYGRDPMPQLLMLEEQERRGPKGSCEFSARDLCYDLSDGRLVYRPARQFMPKFEGLTPENITLRSNRIVFKYSFR